MTGTTAVCFEDGGKIQLLQSAKNQNADQFILDLCAKYKPPKIFIDAPLSLPAKILDPTAEGDHFYRECDRLLGAMSPMFLGGLTARAIRLKDQLAAVGIECIETYPAAFVKIAMGSPKAYKNDLPEFLQALGPFLSLNLTSAPENWHQIDALLAWTSGRRHLLKQTQRFGQPIEGVIVI